MNERQHLPIKIVCHINKIKYKSHISILIDAEKAFNKIQHPFIMKILNKLDIERT